MLCTAVITGSSLTPPAVVSATSHASSTVKAVEASLPARSLQMPPAQPARPFIVSRIASIASAWSESAEIVMPQR